MTSYKPPAAGFVCGRLLDVDSVALEGLLFNVIMYYLLRTPFVMTMPLVHQARSVTGHDPVIELPVVVPHGRSQRSVHQSQSTQSYLPQDRHRLD